MASLMALAALAIDAMLPALPLIARDLQVIERNAIQYVISSMFLGMAFGQVLIGPLSDSLGRRPCVILGLGIFVAGTLISIQSDHYPTFLFGRVLQGFGAASARIVTVAMVRDLFSGADMAKVMSQILVVFIAVPALAPAFGQAILSISTWRAIFIVLMLVAALGFVWFTARQPETLPPEVRTPLSIQTLWNATIETLIHPVAWRSLLSSAMIFSCLIAYLSTAQQIFQDTFHKGASFAGYFAMLALCVGGSSYANSRWVQKRGIYWISVRALLILSLATGVSSVLVLTGSDLANKFWFFMPLMMICFNCFGFLFGNLNALAVEPLGHIAGTATAVVGFVQTLLSAGVGAMVGQLYNGSAEPMILAMSALAILALTILYRVDRFPKTDPI